MNIILRLLGKKVVHEGNTYIQYPINGWKGRVCEYITDREFRKAHSHIPLRQIAELKDVIKNEESLLREKKVIFIIDIQKDKCVEVQITHPVSLFDVTKDEKYKRFGYVVHWNFDPTNATTFDFEKLDRFKKMKNYNEFIHSTYMEDVETFSYDCMESPERAAEIVGQIFSEVFLYGPETKYYFTFGENGTLE